jgi:hypothetical protein
MNTQTEQVLRPAQAVSISQSGDITPVPVLGEGFQESHPIPASASTDSSEAENGVAAEDGKPTKRRLFGFGRKKKDDKEKGKKKDDGKQTEQAVITNSKLATSKSNIPKVAPIQSTHPYRSQSPPNRNLHSSSPRVVSPAGSQIFERDVQEAAVPVPNSPAIPSHIQTENHIPAVLDASSEAITDNNLDPDSVEIVMHSLHQSAAMTVTGIAGSDAAGGNWADDLVAHPDKDDAASNYGALDNTDVRRLSFISFADVVQSEQAEHFSGREPMHIAGLTSFSSGHRSPSPMRSTVSSQGVNTSPPTSKSASIKGVDLSPSRAGKPLASPTLSFSSPSGSELTIETMAEALKKTGSGDLSGTRSQPLSPVSPGGHYEHHFP